MGAINVGTSNGSIAVDGVRYELEPKDALYIPMGTETVTFESSDSVNPTRFYLASTPAHARFEVKHISMREAVPLELGSTEAANERTVYLKNTIAYFNFSDGCCRFNLLVVFRARLKPVKTFYATEIKSSGGTFIKLYFG